jgi:hypothetical protein
MQRVKQAMSVPAHRQVLVHQYTMNVQMYVVASWLWEEPIIEKALILPANPA